jgi:hypothetical protein
VRKRLPRTLLLCAIGLLFLISVPWYRSPGSASSLWFGLPDWVAIALGCYVLAAVLNSVAWLLTDIRDGDP